MSTPPGNSPAPGGHGALPPDAPPDEGRRPLRFVALGAVLMLGVVAAIILVGSGEDDDEPGSTAPTVVHETAIDVEPRTVPTATVTAPPATVTVPPTTVTQTVPVPAPTRTRPTRTTRTAEGVP